MTTPPAPRLPADEWVDVDRILASQRWAARKDREQRPIRDLDVPLTQLQADLRRALAEQRVQASVERLGWLIAHPEAATSAQPAPDGEAAEMRHLLYDADEDASVPAFPYPTQPAEES